MEAARKYGKMLHEFKDNEEARVAIFQASQEEILEIWEKYAEKARKEQEKQQKLEARLAKQKIQEEQEYANFMFGMYNRIFDLTHTEMEKERKDIYVTHKERLEAAKKLGGERAELAKKVARRLLRIELEEYYKKWAKAVRPVFGAAEITPWMRRLGAAAPAPSPIFIPSPEKEPTTFSEQRRQTEILEETRDEIIRLRKKPAVGVLS
ncbi:hypothetical protein ES703_92915 [subsurface metagenome]